MKTRLVSLLVLSLAALVLTSAPASAQQPIPGIKQTVAFKQLKNYVQFLFTKRATPVVNAKRQTFKTNLSKHRKNTNLKVVQLYSRKLMRIAAEDDVKQRRQIKQIRVAQKRQVQGLKQEMADRLAELRGDQNDAVQRVYDSYASQINSRADERDRLKRQLSRTTNPARRTKLTRQIKKLQTQINGLVSDRTTDVNNVNSRYQSRITATTNLYNSRIAQARASAKRQIQQTNNAWKQTFRTQIQAAKARRDAQKDLVGTVADRGFGYIGEMPPADQ